MSRQARMKALLRRAESGAGAVSFQIIGYVYLLTVLLALVYDFGAVIFAQQVLKSAVVVASQELAKDVDEGVFYGDQEVRLVWRSCDDLKVIAQGVADNVSGGSTTMRAPRITITSACMSAQADTDVVTVRGSVQAQLPALSTLIGMAPITLNAEAVAKPEYGITSTSQ
jgi:Flp pilus assembly protein TadG